MGVIGTPAPIAPRPITVTPPKLPTIGTTIPTPIKTPGVVSTTEKTGFDFGGLIDTLSGVVGKFIDYNTAKINNGSGTVVYQTAPGAVQPTGTIGGFDFSNPLVLAGIGFGIYYLTKK